MQSLNTPIGLSLVDDFILKQIPRTAKCGIVVNAGDGRLSRAIKENDGDTTLVYNVEPRIELNKFLENGGKKSVDPWDIDWYEQIAKKNKGFDFIIFLNIHEYWNGNLYSFQRILKLLKPDGMGFLSFYNKSSLYEMRQAIPPFSTGFEQLANPMSGWAKTDLTSWMIYLADVGLMVDQIWGMLEDEAFNYSQKNEKRETDWKSKGLNVHVRDIGDAYIFGAPVICVRFQPLSLERAFNPKLFGVKYDASMLQAILFPYLSIFPNELDVFRTHLEVDNRAEEENGGLVLLNFFVAQLEDFEEVKDVLVIGCNWGIDLLALKKVKPNWKLTGVDGSRQIVSIGSDLMKSEGIKTVTYADDGKLPFDDNSFDIVISLKHFSNIHPSLAKQLAREMIRVSRKGIGHFEDLRGPDFSMQLKIYSIPDIYAELGYDSEVRSMKAEEGDSGLYLLKVKK